MNTATMTNEEYAQWVEDERAAAERREERAAKVERQERQEATADAIMLSLQLRQFRSYDAMTLDALLEETGLTMDEASAGLEMLDNCSEIIIDRTSGEETFIRIAE